MSERIELIFKYWCWRISSGPFRGLYDCGYIDIGDIESLVPHSREGIQNLQMAPPIVILANKHALRPIFLFAMSLEATIPHPCCEAAVDTGHLSVELPELLGELEPNLRVTF
jgi:hypothetical protein